MVEEVQKVSIKIEAPSAVKKKPVKKEPAVGELSDYKIKIPNDDFTKTLKEPTFTKSKSYTPSARPSSKKRKPEEAGPLSTIAQYPPEETPYTEPPCECDCLMQQQQEYFPAYHQQQEECCCDRFEQYPPLDYGAFSQPHTAPSTHLQAARELDYGRTKCSRMLDFYDYSATRPSDL